MPQASTDPKHCKMLGDSFADRYESSGDLDDLNSSIENYQAAVSLVPQEHPHKAVYLQNLGLSYTTRFVKLGDVSDLESSLQNFQAAVNATPEGHPHKPAQLKCLGTAFMDRYRSLGNLDDLEAALKTFREAIDLVPDRHPDKARYLQDLGAGLADRYRRLNHLTDLKSHLQITQQVVELTPHGHPDEATHLRNLAGSFRDQYRRLGALKDLEAAMQNSQKAVNIVSKSQPGRAECLLDLAICFSDRHQRLGDLEDLECALQLKQEAVDLTPRGDPNRPWCLESLAMSFANRYRELGDLEDLETALHIDQEALELTPEGHPERFGRLANLGVSYAEKYRKSGDIKNLDTALKIEQQAIDLTPRGHIDMAGHLDSLAISLTERYRRLGDLKDLEAALQMKKEAVDLTPEGHPDRLGWLQSLAISHTHRYRRLGDLKDLNTALQMKQEAVNLTPDGHSDAGSFLSLGLELKARYKRLGDLKDLEFALKLEQQAVNLIPKGHYSRPECLHNLGISFVTRYQRLKNIEDLASAISLLQIQEAVELTPDGHPDRALYLQSRASLIIHRYKRLGDLEDLHAVHSHYRASFNICTSTPEYSWNAALNWASFAHEFSAAYCVTAYSAAFKLLQDILWIGHSIPLRHHAVQRLNVGAATSTATRTCISLSYLRSAVENLEQGIATTFQQMLQLKTNAEGLDPEQARMFEKLSSELYSGTSVDPMRSAIERQDLLDIIRRQPHLKYFLLPRPYHILSQASQGGSVVILNSHKNGCDGIILLNPSSEPIHVPLRNVTLDMLQSQRLMLQELIGRCNVRTREDSAATRLFGRRELSTSKSIDQCFADLLAWLGSNVLAPIYQQLKSHNIINGRLWWLPTGAFTGLPIHAGSDQFIHSYTATLGSLVEAYAKTTLFPVKIGIVGIAHTGPGRVNFLKGVEQEVTKMKSIIPHTYVQVLKGEEATVDAVKLQLLDCSWVHLACHGTQNLIEPIKSHLQLYGGTLDLETIMQMPLSKAQFVFLAACQTATGDAQLVNESFHLGGGFIAAGFRGAIGTLWSMNDQDGPLVAEMFYSYLFREGRRPQASGAAEALQLTVNELKKKVPYERWLPFIHMGV
ncbi:CHAT domain-containing protein [Mycena vulgaris]|nr:CHAT domain-containing protein [Mycena vulgaris]